MEKSNPKIVHGLPQTLKNLGWRPPKSSRDASGTQFFGAGARQHILVKVRNQFKRFRVGFGRPNGRPGGVLESRWPRSGSLLGGLRASETTPKRVPNALRRGMPRTEAFAGLVVPYIQER